MSAAALRIRKFCIQRASFAAGDGRWEEEAVLRAVVDYIDQVIEEETEKQFTRPIGGALDDPRTTDKVGYPW